MLLSVEISVGESFETLWSFPFRSIYSVRLICWRQTRILEAKKGPLPVAPDDFKLKRKRSNNSGIIVCPPHMSMLFVVAVELYAQFKCYIPMFLKQLRSIDMNRGRAQRVGDNECIIGKEMEKFNRTTKWKHVCIVKTTSSTLSRSAQIYNKITERIWLIHSRFSFRFLLLKDDNPGHDIPCAQPTRRSNIIARAHKSGTLRAFLSKSCYSAWQPGGNQLSRNFRKCVSVHNVQMRESENFEMLIMCAVALA